MNRHDSLSHQVVWQQYSLNKIALFPHQRQRSWFPEPDANTFAIRKDGQKSLEWAHAERVCGAALVPLARSNNELSIVETPSLCGASYLWSMHTSRLTLSLQNPSRLATTSNVLPKQRKHLLCNLKSLYLSFSPYLPLRESQASLHIDWFTY